MAIPLQSHPKTNLRTAKEKLNAAGFWYLLLSLLSKIGVYQIITSSITGFQQFLPPLAVLVLHAVVVHWV